MQLRSRLIRLKLGLQTVLGLRRGGFFIPYGRAANVAAHEYAGYPWIKDLFDTRRADFARLLSGIDQYAEDLLAIQGLEPPQPRFEQDWFPRLDAAAHYAMVRTRKPARIVEIGSGHSTRFMCRAVADGGLSVAVTAIDPQPRADISQLPVTVIRSAVQDADPAVFASLGAGDFLCIDSSHVFMPGSDVEVLINRVLPSLPPGVFVFFHDVFLPKAYPRDWAGVSYNEHNAIAVLLQGPYEPVFASAYAVEHMAVEIEATVLSDIPLYPGGIENGLWLRKV